MDFYEKLDFLMNLTGISNSKMAKLLNVDSSLVSRWRRGLRMPGNFTDIVSSISDILTPQIQYDFQREALAVKADMPLKSFSGSMVKESLTKWLSDNKKTKIDPVSRHTLNKVKLSAKQHMRQSGRKESIKLIRAAIERAPQGGTFRIYTDEPASWVSITTPLSKRVYSGAPKFNTLKLMFPSTINYDEIKILWKQVERHLGTHTLYVSILNRAHTDIFQHAVFIADDYALLSSFGFYNCDSVITVTNGQKRMIQDTIEGFDHTFNRGENGLTHLENYTVWEDFELFDKVFTMRNNVFYYGSVINPLFVPADLLKKLAKHVMGAMKVSSNLFSNIQVQSLNLLKTNQVYTSFPLYTPDEVACGKACLPNIPQFINGMPAVDKAKYKDILVYISGLYRQNDNLHLMPLYRDTVTTFGMQEYNTLSIIQMHNSKAVNYCSKHSGIIATTARALEERFHNFEKRHTKAAVLRMLEKQILLFE